VQVSRVYVAENMALRQTYGVPCRIVVAIDYVVTDPRGLTSPQPGPFVQAGASTTAASSKSNNADVAHGRARMRHR